MASPNETSTSLAGQSVSGRGPVDLVVLYEHQILPQLSADAVYPESRHRWDRASTEWSGDCPWHDSESKRSFKVSPSLDWYCYGCGVGGGPIQYLHRVRGGDGRPRGAEFAGVLRELADLAGTPFPVHDLTPEARQALEQEEGRRLAVTDLSHALVPLLWADDEPARKARDYLASRGLDSDQARELGIGFFPCAQGVEEALSGDARTRVREAKLLAPRFAGFVYVPWADHHGRPLTAYGRYVGTPPEGTPKTMALPGKGSKRSPLYLDRALRAGHRHVVAVEGVLDAAVLQARGQNDVIAYVAGAFSQAQITTLRRCGIERVTIVADPDDGGDKGCQSSVRRLSAAGIETLVAPRLPDGQDPDEFVLEHGVQAWQAHVAQAVPGQQWRVNRILDGLTPDSSEVTKREAVSRARRLAEGLAGPQAALDRASLIDRLKAATGYAKRTLEETIPKPKKENLSESRDEDQAPRVNSRYEFRPTGLYELIETDRGCLPVRLANLVDVRIEAMRLVDDGAVQQRELGVRVQVAGHSPQWVSVPTSKFESLLWIYDIPGAAPEPGRSIKDRLRHAIQTVSGVPPTERVFAHLGWADLGNGAWGFVHAGGAMTPFGVVAVRTSLPDALSRYRIPPPDPACLASAVRASLRLLEVAPRVTHPLFAAIWRAPLGGARLCLFLVGTTGSFKSALTALVQQHFGAEMDYDSLPLGWEGTANAIEAIAFAAKDVVLAVDDFVPGAAGSQLNAYHKKFDRLIRGLANGQGRARMRDTTQLRVTRWPRGVLLSSGEDLPRGASVQARLVVLPLARADVDVARLSACQGDARSCLYAAAMSGYLDWLAPRIADLRCELTARLPALRSEFNSSAVHGRTPSNMAELAFGQEVFARFAVEVGALDRAEADRFLSKGLSLLQEVARLQGATRAEQDPVFGFLEMLSQAVACGRGHLLGPRGIVPREYGSLSPLNCGWRLQDEGNPGREFRSGIRSVWTPRGEALGYVDVEADDLFLLPDVALRVTSALSGGEGSLTRRALGTMLQERALLKTRKGEGNQSRLPGRFGGGRQYVWHLHATRLLGGDVSDASRLFPEPDGRPLHG